MFWNKIGNIRGPQGISIQGPAGLPGKDGKDGKDAPEVNNVIYSILKPVDTLGKDGDWALCETNEIYRRVNGKWKFFKTLNMGSGGGGGGTSGASGDVVGPASSTDNAIARYNGITGKLIQNSGVIIDDSNNVSGIATLTATTKINIGSADTMTVNGVPVTSFLNVDADVIAPIEIHTHSNAVGAYPLVYGAKSRGTSASPTVVASGDVLLNIVGVGFDGTDYATSAGIAFEVDGTPGANDMPGKIIFNTSADGAQILTERLHISSTAVVSGNNIFYRSRNAASTIVSLIGIDAADNMYIGESSGYNIRVRGANFIPDSTCNLGAPAVPWPRAAITKFDAPIEWDTNVATIRTSGGASSFDISVLTGTATSTASGAISIRSGSASGTANSGDVSIGPGGVSGSGTTGKLRLRLPTEGTAGHILVSNDTTGGASWASQASAVDHGSIGGLADDDHTQYALLAGRSGGQTLTGGTAASNNLVLRSTTNATKGQVFIDETTASTSVTTGALRVAGGIGVSGRGTFGSISSPGGGSNSERFGAGSSGTADGSTALGASAAATNTDSIAIGRSSAASGSAALAIGATSIAGGAADVTIGNNSTTGSSGSNVAIGGGTSATGGIAVAVGNSANAGGAQSVALGYLATVNAAAFSSVAVGPATTISASGVLAFALGPSANAQNFGAVAVGFNSLASGTSAFSIGSNSTSSGTESIAIGATTTSSGTNSVAIGSNAEATATGSVAIGGTASSISNNSVAIGSGAAASSGTGQVAIGANSGITASGNDNISIGRNVDHTGTATNAIGIGSDISNSRSNALLIGDSAAASANNYAVIGSSAMALTNFFFGNGETNSAPQASTSIGTTGGSGTNIVGSNLIIHSGIGTGNSAVSSVTIQTPTIGASGSTAQTLANRVIINSTRSQFVAEVEIDGDLNHDGSNIGFYGVTPVARPAAYTQTYSTTTRTHSNLTSATLTDSTTGTADTTVADVGAAFSQATLNNNFADLIAQVNALRVDLTNVKNVLNQVIDDLQSNGILQ